MPYRAYRPDCDGLGAAILTGSPDCRMCAAVSDFDFWKLSMHEAMARFQVLYGSKLIRRRKKRANAVLGSKRVAAGYAVPTR